MAIVLMFCACAALTGCLNPISLDNYGYVVTIGADKGKEEKYEVILELQRERSNEGSENEGGSIILSSEGNTLFEAINRISYRTAYPLNFTRTHVFIFGEELAREGMIEDFFKLSFDKLRIRQSAIVMIVQCTLREYLGGLAANNNPNLTKFQDDMLYDQINSGQIAVTDLSTFLEACDGEYFDPVTPVGFFNEKVVTDASQKTSSSEGKNPLEDAEEGAPLGGTMSLTTAAALFDGWKMTGMLTPHDTQFMNMGRGEFKSGTITCSLSIPKGSIDSGKSDKSTEADKPGKQVPIALLAKMDKRTVKVDMSGEKIKVKVSLNLDISVEQDATRTIGEKWNEGMHELVQDYFVSELERVFKICQECNSDAMGLGKYVSKEFRTVAELEAFDWKKNYADIEVEFDLNLMLDDFYIAISRQ